MRASQSDVSDFRVEVEEGVDAHAELPFDLFAGAFEDMHGDMGFVSVGKFERRVLDRGDFALGQEAETVDQSQIRHEVHLICWGDGGLSWIGY